MAFRPEVRPYQVLTNGSMAGSLTSSVTIIQKISKVSYTFVWSAGSTPVGTVSVQGSNDYAVDSQGNVSNSGNWKTLTITDAGALATTVAVSGATGSTGIDVETGFYAIRAIYTRSSGSGTLNAYVCGKVS